MAATPYADDRWDFAAARRAIGTADDVVDLGAAAGGSSPRWARAPAAPSASTTTRRASPRSWRGGGEAYACSFQEFAAREAGGFDVVTTFHTLEHVRRARRHGAGRGRCLRPEGGCCSPCPTGSGPGARRASRWTGRRTTSPGGDPTRCRGSRRSRDCRGRRSDSNPRASRQALAALSSRGWPPARRLARPRPARRAAGVRPRGHERAVASGASPAPDLRALDAGDRRASPPDALNRAAAAHRHRDRPTQRSVKPRRRNHPVTSASVCFHW